MTIAAITILLNSARAQAEEGAAAPAANPAKTSRGLEEIIVTARKKSEDLQTVPLSIATLGVEEMQNRGIETLADLAAQTAGMEFASTGTVAGTRPIIRGLSQQTRVGDETNVASFIDGVYTPGFSGSTLLFDALERIEVVRGPQSAAYGRNSFAGAINYVSSKPGDELDFGVRSTVGTDEKSALSGYISGPVFGPVLAARLDVAYRDTGGTLINQEDGEPLSASETKFVRLSLRSELDWVLIDAAVNWNDDDFSPPARTSIADTDPRRVGKPPGGGNPFEIGSALLQGLPSPRIGRLTQGEITDVADQFFFDPRAGGEREGILYSLNFDFDLGDFNLELLTGYSERELTSISDVDQTPLGTTYASGLASSFPNGPITVQGVTGSREDRDQLSQDVQLSFDGDGPFNWSVGGYYSTENFRDQRIRAGTPALEYVSGDCPAELFGTPPPTECLVVAAIPQMSIDLDADLESTFYSVYSAFEWLFLDTWALNVEGRYTWEEKSAVQLADNYPSNRLPVGDLGSQRFKYFTPRVNLSNQVTDDLLLYGLVAKGIKSGGFNSNASLDFEQTYQTESNWTFELGGKWTFWDDRARINVAAYWIEWNDQQITTFAQELENGILIRSADPIVDNIGASQIRGLETEIVVVPTDWLSLNLGYAYNDGEYEDAVFNTSAGYADCLDIGVIECVFDPAENAFVSTGRADGNQLKDTSKHQLNVGVEVQQPIGIGEWDAFFRTDYAYRSKRYVDAFQVGWVPSRETVNLRLGVRNLQWNVEGFCENLTDDDTPTTGFPPRDFLGVPRYMTTNRTGRICGMTAGFRFK